MANIKTLPLFPLNIVAFPGERVNLHIFEPRYKELINDCLNADEGENTFGIPTYMDSRVMDFGTEMKVIEIVKEYEDGKMDIRLEGIQVFRIIEFFQLMPFKKYSGARVSLKDNDTEFDFILQEKMRVLIQELFKEVGLHREIEEFNSFTVAHYIGMTLKQEYELLSTLNETLRVQKIIDHLNKAIPSVKQTKLIRDKIQMNGHFRKLDAPDF